MTDGLIAEMNELKKLCCEHGYTIELHFPNSDPEYSAYLLLMDVKTGHKVYEEDHPNVTLLLGQCLAWLRKQG
jgi:hypothetical protein